VKDSAVGPADAAGVTAPPDAQGTAAPHELADELHGYRLPDGRQVRCTSPAEAQLLWSEVSSEGFYRRAAARLTPGDVVVDVGANIGLASLGFADAQPEARLIALEPVPVLFACLEGNLAAHTRHGRAVRAAVGSEPGRRTLTYYPSAPGNSGLYADQAADDRTTRTFLRNRGLDEDSVELLLEGLHSGIPVEVEVTTVSDVLRDHGSPEVSLLKVDVERAEQDVLRGIRAGDWPRIHCVVAEVHDEDDGLRVFRSLLHDHGFGTEVRQDPALRGTELYEVLATRP
jgi:FkbM family methyltransferase